jgi:hypothetical protein
MEALTWIGLDVYLGKAQSMALFYKTCRSQLHNHFGVLCFIGAELSGNS